MAEGDSWDEVWQAYDVGRATLAAPRLSDAAILDLLGPSDADVLEADEALARRMSVTGPPPAAHPGLRLGCWLMLLLGAMGLGVLAAPRLEPALAIAQLWLRPDVGTLLETLQASPGQFAARPMPAIAASRPGGAGRYLDMLAQDLRSGWSDPEAMRRLIVARQSGPGWLRDPALPALERIHSIAATGWSSVRLEIGPANGRGGLSLDLDRRAGAWQVARFALLDSRP
ncbi:hypothetical protein [Teichococcus aerofrigidensis]